MRIAIFSDIHSNLQALEAVIAQIESLGADEVYCLGDIVGYGADPGPCLDLVREHCDGVVLGNHDLAVATESGLEVLPPEGQDAAIHNSGKLDDESLRYLENLPLLVQTDIFTLVHASPQFPERWQRLMNYRISHAQFDHFSTDICFFGHTHSPAVMSASIGVSRVRKGHRFLINVGSVGQPRDGDPRACLAILETDTFDFELHRIAYDVEAAQARIIEEELPSRLAERLAFGR